MRSCLGGEPARDLAHRRQQWQPAILGLDRLVRDAGDPALHERARERLVRGDVQVGEEHEPFTEPWILRRNRLLHLEQELGALPDFVDGRDPGAVRLVLLVGELAAGASTGLDDDIVPALDQLARTCGRQRDPVLLRLDLLRDADAHGAETIPLGARESLDVARAPRARATAARRRLRSPPFAPGFDVAGMTRSTRGSDRIHFSNACGQVSIPNGRSGASSSGRGGRRSSVPEPNGSITITATSSSAASGRSSRSAVRSPGFKGIWSVWKRPVRSARASSPDEDGE